MNLVNHLKNNYCSRDYIDGLFGSLQTSTFPQTPAHPSRNRKSAGVHRSAKASRAKENLILPAPLRPNMAARHSPNSNISKPTHKRNSMKKKKNRSLKAVSAKTHKKKKTSQSKSRSRKHKQSGSPCSFQEQRNSRYMSALKYVEPGNPGRFWLTGTLGKSTRIRKVRKKSNSLNMKRKKKMELSLSNLNKNVEPEDMENIWGLCQRPKKQSKVSKVDIFRF